MSSLPPETRAETHDQRHLTVRIDFETEDGVAAEWNEPRLGDLVRAILTREFPGGGQYAVSLHLVGYETIQAMNAEHRGIDAPTDVLSFPLSGVGDDSFVLPPGELTHLGDVVICYPRAMQQADEYGHSTAREIGYLVAHGLLHILGYDHEADVDRHRMRLREEEALRPLGFIR